MKEISEYEATSLSKLSQSIEDGKWGNDGLVQLIERAGMYLNLETIPNYAKKMGMSYNGVKKHRYIRSILGVKMVIDND